MNIGAIIRKARESKNYTQEYAAKKSGICVTAYGDIERGKSDPAWSRVLIIANTFGISILEMLKLE